jgi:RNA polymerase sigma-70 factor (ECF subfamily)
VNATDEELFGRFREQGDEFALAELVERHWKRTFSIARSITGEPAGAEDAAQQAFVRVVAAARRNESVRSFAGWLNAIVVTEARNERRSAERRVAREVRAARSEVVTGAPSIREHVEALPEKLRVPVVLHYAHGLSHEEVASALGCPTGTASSWIRRGLEELRAREGVASATALGVALVAALTRPGAGNPKPPAAAALLAARRARPAIALPAAALALTLGATVLTATFVREPVVARDASPSRSEGATVTSSLLASRGASANIQRPGLAVTDDPGSTSSTPGSATSPSVLTPELLELLEPDRAPGPYPWNEPAPNHVEKRLRDQKLTFTFAESPFADVVEFLRVFIEVRVEPRLEDRLKDRTVSFRVRDVLAEQFLELLCEQLRGPDFSPGYVTTDRELVFIEDRTREPLAGPRSTVADLLAAEGRELDVEARRRLEQPIALRLERAPLDEALAKLAELTGLNFVHAPSVPAETTIDAAIDSAPATAALDKSLTPAGLAWELREGTVFVMPEAERPCSAFATQRVSLDLRGATVEDLVRELASHGVDTVASPGAWRSRGTFSLVFSGTVSELLAAIHAKTPFDAWTAPRSRDPLREALVVKGECHGAREALALELPGNFSGIVAEASELRARLVPELVARRAARAGPAGRALDESEARVIRTVARIFELAENARHYAEVPDWVSHRKEREDCLASVLAKLATEKEQIERERDACARDRRHFAPGSEEEKAFDAENAMRLDRLDRESRTIASRVSELTRKPSAPWIDQEEAWKHLVAGARLAEAEAAATRR